MGDHFVSVIFVTLNEEKYIGRTLRFLRKALLKCGINFEATVADSS